MILGWVLCDCPGVQDNPAGYGHHQVRCIAGCTSVWYDPPHTKQDSQAPCLASSGRVLAARILAGSFAAEQLVWCLVNN